MSNLFVYGVTFFLLKFHEKEGKPDDDADLTRDDAPKFM